MHSQQTPYLPDSEPRFNVPLKKQIPIRRVWVDRELRIDTALSHPLAPDRKQTFAISEFGTGPQIRALRVWKGAGN